MDPINVLIWVVIVVFAGTAIITLGGLVKNFTLIQVKESYLKKLFAALILETVAVCIPLAAQAIKDSRCDDDCFAEKIRTLDPESHLAKNILQMRDSFTGIFRTPEYAVEITFADFENKDIAKVCPNSPLYRSNVMVFNEARDGGVLVIPLQPAPELCSNSSHSHKIILSKLLARNEFNLGTNVQKIIGWGRVIPATPTL